MADVALTGLRWVASPIVNKLLANISTYLGVDLSRELQELEIAVLPQFDLVIEAAEKSPHRDKMKAWLQRLKEAFYDAEDVLDEHEYNLLKRKAKSGKEASPQADAFSVKATILKPLRSATSRARNLLPENRRLISKMNEMKVILSEAKDFRELLGLPAGYSAGASDVETTIVPPATSIPPQKVFGRDKDRDHIVGLLTKETAADTSSTGYSGVAIVAHGGAGKSTLAQYVYNDDRVKKHFDVRMWVCISRKLDVHRHTGDMIESATNESCQSYSNPDTLQCKLRDILQKSGKFLIVLDDVWFDESSDVREWDRLLGPLVAQKSGSKVLITSRRDVLPPALCCKEVVRLENMEEVEFLALFKHYAFSGEETGNERLEEMSFKIAKRLGQSPLAARVVGSQLSSQKDIATWKTALESFQRNKSDLQMNKLSEVMRALLWSYGKLDPHLQRCLLYCSLFPKGYKYNIDELVHLWVAEGLVDACNHNTGLEDVGRDYFNRMLSGSFFQQVTKTDWGYSRTWYVIHDLLHDLAESFSREDCFRLEDGNEAEIPSNVRHLSVRVDSLIKHKQSICKLHHLRTVICIDPLMDDVNDLFHQILENLKKLRVLYLSCYNKSKLPESVANLKHLRYLNLIKTLIHELPRSLGTLYNLQLLHLNLKVKSLPDELCNLSKLRHLEGFDILFELFKEGLPQIPDIGRLTSLQRLHEFSVQKKKGYDLRQLKDMNELGGSLKITNLENVTGKDEALETKLQQKRRLRELKFSWDSENDMRAEGSTHLGILEGLMPPSQLESLRIEGYKSARYPSWLLNGSYFENLESFGLHNCSVLEGLPPDIRLLRHCSKLMLKNVPNLKTLPCLPAGLRHFSVQGCPLLMFITDNELEQYEHRENLTRADHLASQLALIWEVDSGSDIKRTLKVEHASLKQMMPLIDDDISKQLQTFESAIQEERDELVVKENIIKAWLCCHHQRIKLLYSRKIASQLVIPSAISELRLESCSISDEAFADCLGGFTSLRRLTLENIMTLTTLPSEEVFDHLTKLDYLYIESCWCLRSLGGLRAATCLFHARFRSCPSLQLERAAEFMPLSLRELVIHICMVSVDSFSNGLPHLEKIIMYGCRTSASLSIGHLTSLKSLNVRVSPDLCVLEGLSSLQLLKLQLIDVPKLTARCILQLHVKESLYVSSFELLDHMLSAEGFTIPPFLCLEKCKEPSVSFKESASFSSVKHLKICRCEMKSLPRNMECLSRMEMLDVRCCPNISSLPDLPSSLQKLFIMDCERLEESCRAPDGESWPKIAHIRWKEFG